MIVRNRHLGFNQLAVEFILLNLAVLLILYLNSSGFATYSDNQLLFVDSIRLGLIFNLSWAIIVLYSENSKSYIATDFRRQVQNIIFNTFILVGITYTLATVFDVAYFLRTTFLLPIFLFSFLNLSIVSFFFEYKKRKGQSAFNSNIVVVGAEKKPKKALKFAQKIQQRGYNLVGVVDNNRSGSQVGGRHLGNINQLSAILENTPVDEIFITLASLKKEEIKQAIDTADYHGVRVNLVSKTPGYINSKYKSYTLDDLPVFKLRETPLDKFNNYLVKKTFDVLFSLTVLILLSPIFLVLALLIYLDNKGPIFYRPMRKGEGGESFYCYKFRTMSVCDDPVNGTESTVENDPRITRVGKYLRKYDLDELPQFINVLKGDMSVVGPRPHRTNLQNDFRKIVNNYMVRHYVKPGITGWAQVNGWRGPTVTMEQKQKRVQHDLWYIENWSLWLDIKIVFLTVFSKKTRKNAF